MARRKYKKTKRKLSRKVIHKTRRRTKNRVKKLSKNQSGGMIVLSINAKTEFESNIATASKKKGRAKPTSLFDEELGKLIIDFLFTKVTNVSFIQDNSRYAYILYERYLKEYYLIQEIYPYLKHKILLISREVFLYNIFV